MSPVSFFMLAASLQRLAVVRFQHLAQPRFRVKHLPSQKYEGQHAVVAVFLQGASADTEQFRHLTVSQVTFPVQRRAVTFQKYRQPFRAFAHILHHRGYRLVFHRKNIVGLPYGLLSQPTGRCGVWIGAVGGYQTDPENVNE